MNEIVEKFKSVYGQLNYSNIETIESIYHQSIVFIDPFGEINGLDNLKNYFRKLYKHVEHCEFQFLKQYTDTQSAMLAWNMTLRFSILAGKKSVQLNGSSRIEFNGNIFRHYDYFDAGALIYEHIPVLGSIVKHIKSKV